MRLVLLLLGCILFLSCGSSHHFAPIRPMTNSNVEGRVSVSYSLSDFHSILMQMGFYFKITDRDMVGFSLQNFVLPNNLSYVRFWEQGNSAGNYQFHINNLLTGNYSPTYEMRYALFNDQREANQSFEMGLGIYATPLLHSLAGHRFPVSFSPILAYQYRGPTIMAQAQYIFNYSRYRTKEILLYQPNEFDYRNNTWQNAGPKLVFESDEIIDIYRQSDLFTTWVIKTSETDSLVLSTRDPYVDCYACWKEKADLSATVPDSTYGVYWVSRNSGGRYLILRNLREALSDYHAGKTVDLRPSQNYVKQSLRSNIFFIDDLSISIGTLLPEE